MNKTRRELLQSIKSLQQLLPRKEYEIFIKQAQQQNLNYIPQHQFLPSMDEKSPKFLNDIELNVLSLSKKNYFDNIFIPIVVGKHAQILIDKKGETKEVAIKRWTGIIKNTQTPSELKLVIEKINKRKSSSTKNKKLFFWKKLFGL